MSRDMCTIIAKNYLAYARTLCESFLDKNADGQCHVLIVDELDGYVTPAEEIFELYTIEDLVIPDIREFSFKYSITELCTATKPYFLKFLFDAKGVDELLYLDPDILVLNPLDLVFDRLAHDDILLTPHLDQDYPDDGLLPNDAHIMRSGIFNLGFIGLKRCENSDRFLRWWQGKLYEHCIINQNYGYFVDQKFIDLAINLFSRIGIVRAPGCNVAYWNLHCRDIEYSAGTWLCNKEHLYFFHFSDYKPDNPATISRHQNRYELSDLPEVEKLFSIYRKRLGRNGYEETKRYMYSYGRYVNNRKINDLERAFYRKHRKAFSIVDPFDLNTYPLSFRIFCLAKKVHMKLCKILGC